MSVISSFVAKSIYRTISNIYELTENCFQSKTGLNTFLTRNQVRFGKINTVQLRYRAIALFLLFLLIPFIVYSCLSPADLYISRLSHIDTNVKPLKRLSELALLHINGSIKHLGAASPIYIINLPHRPDRRTRSIALAQILNFDAFIVPAYSIRSPEVVSRSYLIRPRLTIFDYNFLTIFELACWASHMQVWLEIAASKRNNSWSIIFEDDVDLEVATFEIMKSFPQDLWDKPDMIYLGHCSNPAGPMMYKGAYGYRVHQAINPLCTHAYAIRADTARKLSHLLAIPQRGIDREIASLINTRQLLVFSVHPPLAIQLCISSLNPSNVQVQDMTKLSYRTEKWLFSLSKLWRGVEVVNKLRNSALAKTDFGAADGVGEKFRTKI